MINVSNEIKQAYDVSTTQVDKIILNNQEYRITNVEFYDDVYKDGNVFGTAIAKCLEFEIENIVNLEGEEVEYQTGIIVNGVTQWISLGNFIIQDIEPNDTTNIVRVFAMDYMLKSNISYQSNLNYGDGTVTLLDVLQEVCDNCGFTLATMEFPNSNFIVDSNQFAEGTLNQQVFQAIAQISGTIAKIKNNELYLLGPGIETNKVFTLNNYEEAEIKRATHPINLVSLGMTDIEGENVVLRDDASISSNGENSLVINDNPFAYTEEKRKQLITALFDAVKGFEYKAFSFKCQGLPYLETMDKVQFLDKEGNTYDSYIFRFNYKSPNGLESNIEAPSIIKATVAYQNVLDALEISKRTEILVNKQNQIIQSVVSQTDTQNQKISVVEQTVNELNSKIGDIADITSSQETLNGTVSFEKVNQSEPIYVKIYPTGINISYLYPRDNLYPSDTLYPTGRTLRFTNTTTEEYVDYELPTDLLYFDAENYDEFILDYDAQSCVVNKRVGYNVDGTTYVLDSVETIEYEYPRILLTDGDYTVTLLGYHKAYMFVRLMSQNIYTTQFATKAEVTSEISQTSKEIKLSVDEKLESYPTTTQMNSEISVTAQQINSEVSKKVGNDEIISKINQSAEKIAIQANKININGTVSANGNFKVDTNGNMSCNNAKVTGGEIKLQGGTQDEPVFKIENPNDSDEFAYITPDTIQCGNSDSGNPGRFVYCEGGLEIGRVGGASINLYQVDGRRGDFEIIANDAYVIQGNMHALSFLYDSLEELKKNIKPFNEDALKIIQNIDIYEYNFKNEKDEDKKHIGLVIGKGYNYTQKVTGKDNTGVDNYAYTSLCVKAIQEQQVLIEELIQKDKQIEQLIEQLQKEIKELKGEKKDGQD